MARPRWAEAPVKAKVTWWWEGSLLEGLRQAGE